MRARKGRRTPDRAVVTSIAPGSGRLERKFWAIPRVRILPPPSPCGRPFDPGFLAPLLLILLGVLFFSDVLFSSRSFYFRDILNFHYPLRKVLIDSYTRGELPLWNPYVYLGQPMLANPNYMGLYPTNLLHLLLPFNYAFKLHFVLHPVLGGLGVYFFLRRLGLEGIPALAGGISYQFSGTVLSFLNLYNLVPTTALIPWIGWAFWGALQEMRLRRVFLLGFFLALQIIAFEPLLFQCCLLLMLALGTAHILEKEDRVRALGSLALISLSSAAVAVGLSAAQVLPTLEMLPQSARAQGIDYSVASGWSMHPMDLLSLAIPNFYGYLYTIGSATSWGEAYHELTGSYLVSFFLGSVTLLLALLAVFSTRTRLIRVLAVFALLTAGLALGKHTPLFGFLYHNVPLFSLGRYPSKYFVLTTLLISILAAIGLEAVLENDASGRRGRRIQMGMAAAIVVAAIPLCLGLYWSYHPQTLEASIRAATPNSLAAPKEFGTIAAALARAIASGGAFLLLGSFLLLAGTRLKQRTLFGFLVVFIVGLELMPPNLGLSPLISDADVDYIPELNTMIKQSATSGPFRTVTPNYLSPAPTGMELRAPNRSSAWLVLFNRRSGQSLDGIRNGLQYAIDRSVDHLNSRESDTLMQRSIGLPAEEKLTLLANLNCPLIPALGELNDPRLAQISAVETHSNLDYRLYRIDGSLPRAYFAGRTVVAASHEEALARLLEAKGPLSDTVILESTDRPFVPPPPAERGTATVTRYEDERVACSVASSAPGYLVLLDSWFPGWKAYVDGQEVDILRANYAFRAVPVKAGSHEVQFIYEPTSFYVGAAVSLLTLLAGIFAAIFSATEWGRRFRMSPP